MLDNNSPQESWNMATATMKRFDRTLIFCSFYAQQNDLKNWFNVLLDLRRNLIPFLDEEDKANVESKLNSLPKGWNVGSRIKPQCYGDVAKTLDEVYIIMYCCMRKKGLLLPKSVDSSRSIIEM